MPGAALDASLWPASPALLTLPGELTRAGFGSIPNMVVPAVAATVATDTLDRSTTARLTELAPFQLVSAGECLYLFRQSLVADMEGAPFHEPTIERWLIFACNRRSPATLAEALRAEDIESDWGCCRRWPLLFRARPRTIGSSRPSCGKR